MARAKKSSLDVEEPVVVEGEQNVSETAVFTADKADESAGVVKENKQTKAEAQTKTEEKAKNKGVKICVL